MNLYDDKAASCVAPVAVGNRGHIRLVALGIMALGLLVPDPSTGQAARQQSRSGAIWSGSSGEFEILWSDTDLTAQSQRDRHAVALSARALARDGFDQYKKPFSGAAGSNANCDYERRFALRAVAGSLISFADSYYASCRQEAHPSGEARYTTVDLVGSGRVLYGTGEGLSIDAGQAAKILRLTDLFTEDDIYRNLLGNSLLRPLAERAGSAKPAVLAALLARLYDQNSENGECFRVPRDILTRFELYGFEGGKVIIRLGLPGQALCRENLTTADLVFPVTRKLNETLMRAAAQRQQGFLGRDADDVAAGRVTTVDFKLGRGSGQ